MPYSTEAAERAARKMLANMEEQMEILENCDGAMALIRKEGRESANGLSDAIGHDAMMQALIEKHHGWKIEAPEDFSGEYDPKEIKTIRLGRPTTWDDVHNAFLSLQEKYNKEHPEQVPIGMETDRHGTIVITDYAKAMSGRGREMASEYGRGLRRFLSGYAIGVEELGATFTGSIAPDVVGFFPYKDRFEAVDQYEMYDEKNRVRTTMPDYVNGLMAESLAEDARKQAALRAEERMRERARPSAGGAMSRLQAMLREDEGAENRPDFDAPSFS